MQIPIGEDRFKDKLKLGVRLNCELKAHVHLDITTTNPGGLGVTSR